MSDSSKRQYQSLLLARPLDNFDVDDDSDEQVSDTKEELSLRSKLMRCSFKMILVCRDVLLVVVLLTFTGLTKEYVVTNNLNVFLLPLIVDHQR